MPPEASNVNDLYQVVVRGYQEGQECNNVLHFKTLTPTGDVETFLILALIECFQDTLLPGLSSAFAYDTVKWKRVSPTLGPEHVTPFVVTFAGSEVGDSLPTFNAALISIRTGEGGRSKRGRMFLPGIPDTGTIKSNLDLSGNTWLAIVAFAACMATKFIQNEPIGNNNFRIGVYSRKIGGSAFPYGVAGFTPAISLNPVALIATMRSRKVGRGN